jgi:aspartate kinase
MKVLKFGGTSVGTIQNIKSVTKIITNGERKIVVLSAMSGTTNALVEIADAIKNKDVEIANKTILILSKKYKQVIKDLFENNQIKQQVAVYVDNIFNKLTQLKNEIYNELLYNTIVAQGELLSTFIFTKYLLQQGIKAQLLPALEFMRINRLNEPDNFYIQQNLNRIINENLPADVYITQGFICLDADGNIANLQRGGSDYSATIIGAAIDAEEVQIWTDIDGMHNNDPRYVDNTHAISNLSYEEAAELAYFGARILHPQTVMPARSAFIPVRLKNTMQPERFGTLINNEVTDKGIKAIAAKDGITAIKIKSARMLLAYGFLKKVFEIFEKYETPIDMITTSEIAVSLTIDNITFLDIIIEELEKFSTVEVDKNQSIVCLVGHAIVKHKNTHHLFNVLQDFSIRMISYGGSENNISLLINTEDKINVLRNLNKYVFEHSYVV